MPTIDVNIGWQMQGNFTSAGKSALLFSASDFKQLYLWGIPVVDITTGREPNADFFTQKLLAAQAEVEAYFDLKLFRQPITETKDFLKEEFINFGYIKTSYPINDIYTLKGRLNQLEIINYPSDWLTIKRSNDGKPSRNLHIVPNGGSSLTYSYYSVIYPNMLSFGGYSAIPNYWQINYETGFDVVPQDLLDLVGYLAAIKTLPIIEMSVLGSGGTAFGMANQSLSIDGLSQGGSKMNGGNIFKERIRHYAEQIRELLPRLRGQYTGILFDVC